MGLHVRREIERLKIKLVSVSAMVESAVNDAALALEKKDIRLARQVIADDDKIDQMEVELEEDCLKILALYQPVAIDLRYIVAVLKINNDLERIGDLAVNLAKSSKAWAGQDDIRLPEHFSKMAELTISMVHQSLDAMIDMDSTLAHKILDEDDTIDELHRLTFDFVEKRIPESPELTPWLIRLLGISRNLERIADHTTNICEDVLYMISGEIIRHSEADAEGF